MLRRTKNRFKREPIYYVRVLYNTYIIYIPIYIYTQHIYIREYPPYLIHARTPPTNYPHTRLLKSRETVLAMIDPRYTKKKNRSSRRKARKKADVVQHPMVRSSANESRVHVCVYYVQKKVFVVRCAMNVVLWTHLMSPTLAHLSYWLRDRNPPQQSDWQSIY